MGSAIGERATHQTNGPQVQCGNQRREMTAMLVSGQRDSMGIAAKSTQNPSTFCGV